MINDVQSILGGESREKDENPLKLGSLTSVGNIKKHIIRNSNQDIPTYSDSVYVILRWPIVYDRLDKKRFGTNRSMEDMKERFYSIVHELAMLKLEEEEMLMNELKRIEARKKERERKAQDLQKLINMAEAPASPSIGCVKNNKLSSLVLLLFFNYSTSCMSPALGKKKGIMRQKAGAISTVTCNMSFNPVDISVRKRKATNPIQPAPSPMDLKRSRKS
uniref:Bromo domain-containing protein n=1 Tax=Heterorhabditis bacteriophora TaxID=37862 RepID=A0A1I7XMM5_HETBA